MPFLISSNECMYYWVSSSNSISEQNTVIRKYSFISIIAMNLLQTMQSIWKQYETIIEMTAYCLFFWLNEMTNSSFFFASGFVAIIIKYYFSYDGSRWWYCTFFFNCCVFLHIFWINRIWTERSQYLNSNKF